MNEVYSGGWYLSEYKRGLLGLGRGKHSFEKLCKLQKLVRIRKSGKIDLH